MDLSGASVPKSMRIKQMISEVKTALSNSSAAIVSSQFPNYQTEFPQLFAMILKPDYDQRILDHMVAQIEKMEAGRQNQHQASVAVGTVLVDTYVKGKVGQ